MECVCVPFRGCKCLWTGYGSRCQAHRFVSRTAMLLGFSRSKVSYVSQEWSTTQRTSSQLDTTVRSIEVNMSQHPCGTLLPLCSPCPDEIRLFWGQWGQLNIGKVFLMFAILSVLYMGPSCIFSITMTLTFCKYIFFYPSIYSSNFYNDWLKYLGPTEIFWNILNHWLTEKHFSLKMWLFRYAFTSANSNMLWKLFVSIKFCIKNVLWNCGT